MNIYHNILLSVDIFAPAADYITERAVHIAKLHKAKLTILHVVEDINAYGNVSGISTIDLEEQLFNEARKVLSELGKKYEIQAAQQIIKTGIPKDIILEQAKLLAADLIISGSHGRHGFSLLLGSTANGILHHAECDVLAIRIKKGE